MNVNMKQVIAFILTLLPIGASADDHGSCGETLTYTYVEADKTLTISGSGEMTDYKVPNEWGNTSHGLIIKTISSVSSLSRE